MRSVLATMLFCTGLGVAAMPASAGEFPIYGTNDGTFSRDECPPGKYFVGVVGNAGSWLDQITVVCAKPRSDGTFGDSKSLPSRGGPGGAFQKAMCPPNAAVTEINIKHDRDYHITSVALTCKNVKTWQPSTAHFSGQGAYLDSRTYPC